MELTTYDDVNNAWSGLSLPPITTAAAAPIFARLVRRFGVKKTKAQLPRWARDGRRCWAAPKGTDTSRPRANGLPRLVHDASHYTFDKLHPTFKTHSAAHAELEKQMIEYVISSGMHLPKEVAAPSRDEAVAVELAKVESRIKRWQTKAKRAATALRKLARKEKRLRARLGA